MRAMEALADVYTVPQGHLDFRDTIRQIAQERVAPRAAEIDEKAEYPRDIRELFAEHDLFGLPFDTDHGGTGTGALMLNMAIEEISKVCASSALMLMVQELGTLPIRLFGTEEQKQGIRGSPTGQPIFEDVRVPADNLLGNEGEGFKIAMGTLDHSRLGVAAQGLGIAQGATDYAAAYAKERKQFGKPIAAFQAIQFKLADMETQCAAGRELLYQACAKVDRGDRDMGKYSSMAKLFCSDTAMSVTVEAIQVLGGYGYVKEYPVERFLRDAKITQIYEGTNEIQRLVIARTLR